MYKLLKQLKITDRLVDEENNYLLQEEYDKLKEMVTDDSNLKTVLDIYNQYCDEYIKKQAEKGYYVVLTDIHVTIPEKYSTNNNNVIKFYMHVYNEKTDEYKTYDSLKEEGFKPAFIKTLYNALLQLSETTSYVSARSIGYYDKTRNFEFKTGDSYTQALEKNEKIKELIAYFEDKVVVVPKDEIFEQDIKEIYDLLENL